jgi:hypothetical protein
MILRTLYNRGSNCSIGASCKHLLLCHSSRVMGNSINIHVTFVGSFTIMYHSREHGESGTHFLYPLLPYTQFHMTNLSRVTEE